LNGDMAMGKPAAALCGKIGSKTLCQFHCNMAGYAPYRMLFL